MYWSRGSANRRSALPGGTGLVPDAHFVKETLGRFACLTGGVELLRTLIEAMGMFPNSRILADRAVEDVRAFR